MSDPYRDPEQFVDSLDFKRMQKRMDEYEDVHDHNIRKMNRWYRMVRAAFALSIAVTLGHLAWLVFR